MLRSGMHYHNINHKKLSSDAKVQALLAQVEDFKSVMGRNINILLENQPKFDRLQQMSDDLRQDANIFKKKSKILEQKTRRKNCFNSLVCMVVLAVLLYLFTMGICGPGFQSCRVQHHEGANNAGGGGNAGANNGYNANDANGAGNGGGNDDGQ